MSGSSKKPLDFEEVVKPAEERGSSQKGSLLELIPITLIVIGLYLNNQGKPGASTMLILGGGLASLMYLLFSWYMFKVEEYKKSEIGLSILAGLVFPVGILGLVSYYESWPYATELINAALIGAGILFVISLILFIINFRNERASVFYRNLLTRLLVFGALLARLHPEIYN
ncbi:MAG: hypothetical protein ACI8VT_000879 [Saprospiraceae bacterium]|jgi:hypothetical protein